MAISARRSRPEAPAGSSRCALALAACGGSRRRLSISPATAVPPRRISCARNWRSESQSPRSISTPSASWCARARNRSPISPARNGRIVCRRWCSPVSSRPSRTRISSSRSRGRGPALPPTTVSNSTFGISSSTSRLRKPIRDRSENRGDAQRPGRRRADLQGASAGRGHERAESRSRARRRLVEDDGRDRRLRQRQNLTRRRPTRSALGSRAFRPYSP